MRLKKFIGMLILTLILASTICTLTASNTFAANSTYLLGITDVRESGLAYGIGGLKADYTPNKKVWKIVSYPSTDNLIPDYSNAIYCLKAEYGFGGFTNTTNTSDGIVTYNSSLNMKTQSDNVKARLQAINDAINTINGNTAESLTAEDYNKIMWIIDNMYLPKKDTAEDKERLMDAAGIQSIKYGVLLTDDDIEVIQQLAIWYYTNPNNEYYHKHDSNDGSLVCPVLLTNQRAGNTYISYSDLEDDDNREDGKTRLGSTRQNQANKLYKYFVENAEADYTYSTTVTSPVSLNSSSFGIVQDGENFIAGPLKINADTTKNYNITNLGFTDQSNNVIALTGENKLLDQNKEAVESGDIKDVLNQDFYISLPITTTVRELKFNISGNYKVTDATYYTNATTGVEEQPVVLIERNTPVFSNIISYRMPSPQYLDLALRKSITKINGVAPTTNRLPVPDVRWLAIGMKTTAEYSHPKDNLVVDTNQEIEYTINVYNEGGKDGYAAEIKDYLPAGIEFVGLVSASDKYSVNEVRNEDGTTTLTITNTGKTVLNKFNGTSLDSESFTIKCKVTANATTVEQRLVNIAEITKYYDSESAMEKDADKDSQVSNFPNDSKNNTYVGNGVEGNYVKGMQDDDDFEPVIIPAKFLDLALRKSITKINGVAPTTNRLPVPDVTGLGTNTTAIYNHPKDNLVVDTNQEIEYTINIYNEGEKNGYAAEIKDYLPAGIEFVGLVSASDKYSVNEVRNEDGTTTLTITNTGKTVLNKFNGTSLDSESFTIKCKVTANAKIDDQRLVNIAEITKYHDSESNVDLDQDRDSQVSNFPNDSKNNTYAGNGVEGNYVKGMQDDDDFEPVIIPGRYFDLALRKFVSSVNGKALGTSREPIPELTKLASCEDTTATYNHSKTPVSIKAGDTVTYTIRVYNEGRLPGYASEITDHLPQQLEFLADDETNIANGWHYDEEDADLRTIKTSHLSQDVDEENLLNPYNDDELDYRDVVVNCKVKNDVISGEIITNIAEITDFTDRDGSKITDRDSQENNVTLPEDIDLPNYKNDEMDKTYIPGQQDDDDFEKLKVQVFDLALRKFITAVDNEAITSRIPVPTLEENGNIKYVHTKDPVGVQTNNIVTYTLRIYNEGEIAGYASEITDDLPEGLKFLPENELNKEYRWIMIDKDGNKTEDLSKAVKVTTDYLSKEQEKEGSSNLIKAYDKEAGITNSNPDYKDIKISFKVVEPNTSDKILTNIAQISDDRDEDGKPIEDIDSIPGNDDMTEDDIDVEHVKLIYFDLALRKFITKVDNLSINNRYPALSIGEDGNIKYNHTKEPVLVENGNIVTYTLRVYNEGKIAGYASEITDNLPEGLKFLPENELNKEYRWVMIDKDGNKTEDVSKAKKITTDYLSKEQEKEGSSNLIKAFNVSTGITEKNPDYKDVKVAFKVTEPNTSDRILINTAEISNNTTEDGKPVEDVDSTPGNNKDGEDDIDIEKVKVKYFDLALKKWVTQAITIENGKQNVTETGHTGDENPEPVVKVDLKDKKLNKVTVKFKYKIKVTNEGQIEGYAKEVKDYIPDGLKFVKEDNPDWTVLNDKEVVTKKLENTLLKPGESATVEILLTWVNSENNLGLKVNVAEISKDYNESNTPDIDSTPNNKKSGEDDIDEAPVILSVKTGEAILYVTLTSVILITLAGGVILIKKYVL